MFNNYTTKENRHKILKNLLISANIINFSFVEKNKLFDIYPSDFDVVKVSRLKNLNNYKFVKIAFKSSINHQK